MPHNPAHIELDFTIKIEPPSLPPMIPPKMPKGCFSLDLPVGGIMALIRSEMVRLEAHVRSQIEGVKDQLEQQIRDKIPTKQEIIDYIMSQGCEYEPEVTEYYNTLKKGLQDLYKIIDGVKAKIDAALKTIDTLKGKIDQVEQILSGLTAPLGVLGAVVSACKIAINLFLPGKFSPPHALFARVKDKIDQAAATICVMNGNISGIPQSLRVQADRLTEFIDIVNPYVDQMNSLVAQVQELEAVLEAYYLQWIAQCSAAQNGDEDQIPPTDDPFKDYYRIKTYAAITNHINQYPETNPDDWNELSNDVMKEIPEDPEQWTSLQNYEISNRVILVFGPPPGDSDTGGDNGSGRYLIKYYAAIRDNLNKYPEISLQDWNLLKSITVNEIPEDGKPEWEGTVDYIVEDVVKIIIDLNDGSFNQVVSDIVTGYGGKEYIDKLYNAKFRMIEYKRYRE